MSTQALYTHTKTDYTLLFQNSALAKQGALLGALGILLCVVCLIPKKTTARLDCHCTPIYIHMRIQKIQELLLNFINLFFIYSGNSNGKWLPKSGEARKRKKKERKREREKERKNERKK